MDDVAVSSPAGNMTDRVKRFLVFLGGSLGALGVVWVFFQLHEYWDEVDLGSFALSDWLWLSLFFGLSACGSLLLALSWRSVLAGLGVHVTAAWAIATYGISQLARYLPGNIIQFASRQAIGLSAGHSSSALLKSAAWELALIGAAGGGAGLALVGAAFIETPITISLSGVVALGFGAALLLMRVTSQAFAIALGWSTLFLAVYGTIFAATAVIFTDADASAADFVLFAIASIIAWLAGLLTPGAPAGIGVREVVLLSLLDTHFSQGELLRLAVLARCVTVFGDLLWFIACLPLSRRILTIKDQ